MIRRNTVMRTVIVTAGLSLATTVLAAPGPQGQARPSTDGLDALNARCGGHPPCGSGGSDNSGGGNSGGSNNAGGNGGSSNTGGTNGNTGGNGGHRPPPPHRDGLNSLFR